MRRWRAKTRCENFGLIGHVQIADAPGRHEPGTGSAPIQRFLAELD
jgi:hydroxypyruvate isomerase